MCRVWNPYWLSYQLRTKKQKKKDVQIKHNYLVYIKRVRKKKERGEWSTVMTKFVFQFRVCAIVHINKHTTCNLPNSDSLFLCSCYSLSHALSSPIHILLTRYHSYSYATDNQTRLNWDPLPTPNLFPFSFILNRNILFF